MFYRVDYTIAVLLIGFLVGFAVSRRFSTVSEHKLAHLYYIAVAVFVVARSAAFACSMIGTYARWNTAVGVTGDLLSLLLGALFGMATRHSRARQLVSDPLVFSALCIQVAFTFAIAGIGKAFFPGGMTAFFTQSGYPAAFVKIITMGEIFGAVGLLIWWARLPALLGLTIDMFGAVLTHVHNGDPLNDSTGAIALLIRLVLVGVIWALCTRPGEPASRVRRRLLGVGVASLACFLFAMLGSIAVRHVPAPATRAQRHAGAFLSRPAYSKGTAS